MVVIDLLRDYLVHMKIGRSNPEVTDAVLKLSEADLLGHFGDAAVGVVDEYLTDGTDDSIFLEPEFQKTRDLNAFLKSEKLGKSDDFSPNLKTQLALAKRLLRKSEAVSDITAALSVQPEG